VRARESAATIESPGLSMSALDGRPNEMAVHSNLRLGIVVTALVVAGQCLAQAIDFAFFQLDIRALNSDTHASIFGVASLGAQALVVVAAAARSRGSRHRAGWAIVAVLTGLLLVFRVGVSFRAALLSGPVVVLFALLWRLTTGDRRQARVVMRAGLACLAFSYVVHAFGPHVVADLGYAGNSWPYQVKGMLKHSGELAGWLLVAIGIREGQRRPE